MKPVFVLGVGAQKAGTTWLHGLLAAQPFANMGFAKEYHVWDAKLSPLGAPFISHWRKPDTASGALRRLMQQDDGIYAAYFAGLIRGDTTLTGDITPAYSFLDAQAFARIRRCVEGAGFQPRVIFLMRDPVARLWSAVRMLHDRRVAQGMPPDPCWLASSFRDGLEAPAQVARSDYRATIQALEAAFDPAALHYQLYETLFTPPAMHRLQGFLGHRLTGVDLDRRLNASGQHALPADLEALARARLADQYSFCRARFPEVCKLWR